MNLLDCFVLENSLTDEEFEKSLKDTLKTISEKAQQVTGDQGEQLSEDELAKIWSNLGIGGDADGADDADAMNGSFANLMPLMTNMMQNLLSKELLYPALNDLLEKVIYSFCKTWGNSEFFN